MDEIDHKVDEVEQNRNLTWIENKTWIENG
jgi:hypothetical protein